MRMWVPFYWTQGSLSFEVWRCGLSGTVAKELSSSQLNQIMG